MVKAKSTIEGQQLSVHFLNSLGDSRFNQIVFGISDNIHTKWWTSGLEGTFHKAKEHKNCSNNLPSKDIRSYLQDNGNSTDNGSGNGTGNTNTKGNGNGNGANSRLDNAKSQLQQWFPQLSFNEALLSKSRAFGHKCPKHRNVSSHSLLGCNMFTQAATDLGWATVWKSAHEEDNRCQTQSIAARNQVNGNARETDNANQENTNGVNRRQRSNSSNNENNTAVAPYNCSTTVIHTITLKTSPQKVNITATTDKITTTKDTSELKKDVKQTFPIASCQQHPRPPDKM